MHSSLSLGVRGVCGCLCASVELCFAALCPRCFHRRFASADELANKLRTTRQDTSAVSNLRAMRNAQGLLVWLLVSLGFVISASVIGTARAEQSSAPADNTQTHVQNYGDLETTCRRWTDQCRTCSRTNGADPVCSNIGISCQPAGIQCLERKQEDKN